MEFYKRLTDEHYNQDGFWHSVVSYFSKTLFLLLKLVKQKDPYTGREQFCLSTNLWKALYTLNNQKIQKQLNEIALDYIRHLSGWSAEISLNERRKAIRFFNYTNHHAWLLMQNDRVVPPLKELLRRILCDREIDTNEKQRLAAIITGNHAAFLDLMGDKIFANAFQRERTSKQRALLPGTTRAIPEEPSAVEVLQSTLVFLPAIPKESDPLKALCDFWGLEESDASAGERDRSDLLLAASKRFLEMCCGDVLARPGLKLLYQYLLGLHRAGDISEAQALLRLFTETKFHPCNALIPLAKDLYALFLQRAVEEKSFHTLELVLRCMKEAEPACFWDATINLLDFIRTERAYSNKTGAYHAVLRAFDLAKGDFLYFSTMRGIDELKADVFMKLFSSDIKQKRYPNQEAPSIGLAKMLLSLDEFLVLQEAQALPIIHFSKRQRGLAQPFQQLRTALFTSSRWENLHSFKVRVALILSCTNYEELQNFPAVLKTLHQDILKPLSQAHLTTAEVQMQYGYYTKETFYYHVISLTRNHPEWTADICKGIQCQWKYFTLHYRKVNDGHIFFTALQNPHLRTLAHIVCNKLLTMLRALDRLEKPIVRISLAVQSADEFYDSVSRDEETLSCIQEISDDHLPLDSKNLRRWLNSNLFYALRHYISNGRWTDIPHFFENLRKNNLSNSEHFSKMQALATLDNCVNDWAVDLHWFEFRHHALPNLKESKFLSVQASEVNIEYQKCILAESYEYQSAKGGIKHTRPETIEATVFLVEKRDCDFLLLDSATTFNTILHTQPEDFLITAESFSQDDAVTMERATAPPPSHKNDTDCQANAITDSIIVTVGRIKEELLALRLYCANGKLYAREWELVLCDWSHNPMRVLEAHHLVCYALETQWSKQVVYASDERKRRVERALTIVKELKEPSHLAVLTQLTGTAFTAKMKEFSFYGTVVQTDFASCLLGRRLAVTSRSENICTISGAEEVVLRDGSVLRAKVDCIKKMLYSCSLIDVPEAPQLVISAVEYPLLNELHQGATLSVRVKFHCDEGCQFLELKPFEYETIPVATSKSPINLDKIVVKTGVGTAVPMLSDAAKEGALKANESNEILRGIITSNDDKKYYVSFQLNCEPVTGFLYKEWLPDDPTRVKLGAEVRFSIKNVYPNTMLLHFVGFVTEQNGLTVPPGDNPILHTHIQKEKAVAIQMEEPQRTKRLPVAPMDEIAVVVTGVKLWKSAAPAADSVAWIFYEGATRKMKLPAGRIDFSLGDTLLVPRSTLVNQALKAYKKGGSVLRLHQEVYATVDNCAEGGYYYASFVIQHNDWGIKFCGSVSGSDTPLHKGDSIYCQINSITMKYIDLKLVQNLHELSNMTNLETAQPTIEPTGSGESIKTGVGSAAPMLRDAAKEGALKANESNEILRGIITSNDDKKYYVSFQLNCEPVTGFLYKEWLPDDPTRVKLGAEVRFSIKNVYPNTMLLHFVGFATEQNGLTVPPGNNPILHTHIQKEEVVAIQMEEPQRTESLPVAPVGAVVAAEVRGNTTGNIANHGHLVVVGDWIYYAYNGLYKVAQDGTGKTKLCDDQCAYLNAVGNWIYYQNGSDGNCLYRIRTDGGRKNKLNNDSSWYINVVNDQIYYANAGRRYTIYKISTNGTQRRRLNTTSSFLINVTNDWIYYRNRDDGNRLYRMNLKGGSNVRLNSDACFALNVVDGWIYYRNANHSNSLYRIRIDGRQEVQITRDRCGSINMVDGIVYYRNESHGGKLYSVPAQGGTARCISTQNCRFLHELGERIYYINGCDKYSIQKDGNARANLSDSW